MPQDAYEYHRNKKTGKTYVSPSIVSSSQTDGAGMNIEARRRIRIASKVIDGHESHSFVQELGELVLKKTLGGRQEVVAKFYEDDRGIFTLQIQRFNVQGRKPLREYFSFHGDEVIQLIEFILNMKQVHLPDHQGLNVTDDQLRKLLVSREQARTLISENQQLIIEAVKSEITTSDIVAIGYRKKQLECFRGLLENPNINEREWQAFFEKNVWIFGYGLTYLSYRTLTNGSSNKL